MNELQLYFPDHTYHDNKKDFKEILGMFGLKWNFGRGGWFGGKNSATPNFEGSMKPATITFSGDELFIEAIKLFADLIGVKEKEIKVFDFGIKKDEFIEKRVADERKWCIMMGYSPNVGEYFIRKRLEGEIKQ